MINEEDTLVSLASLTAKKQLAFGLLILERMFPCLIAFARETCFEDACYLRAKDAAWAALQGTEISHDLIRACAVGAPDTEEFSHALTSYALNAALAMTETLEFAVDDRAEHIVSVSMLARDSLHLYIGNLEPSVVSSAEKDGWIAAHPLLHQELDRQREDIGFVTSLPDQFDSNGISALRDRARAQSPLLPLTD